MTVGWRRFRALVVMALCTGVALSGAAPARHAGAQVSQDSIVTGINFGRRPQTAPAAVEGSVIRLYQAALDRTYDVEGLNYWVWIYSQGYPLGDMAGFFSGTTEYRRQFDGTTNEQFVRIIYRNVLGREGEAAGVTYWTGLLNSGSPRPEILMYISEQKENQLRTGTPSPIPPRTWLTDEAGEASFVRLQQAAFGQPATFEVSDRHTATLRAGGSLASVAADLMQSPEFQAKFSAMDDARYAAFIHEYSLGFRITPEWSAYWADRMAAMENPRRDLLLLLAQSRDLAVRTRTPSPGATAFDSALVQLPDVDPPDPDPEPEPLSPTSPVLVVGDSLMIQMQVYAQDLGAHPTHYEAISGGSINSIPDQIAAGEVALPGREAVIIHTGTNSWNGSVLGPELERLAPTPVFLINMYFEPDAVVGDPERPWYGATNSGLLALAENNDHVTLIDWKSAATANPAWIAGDGLHMTGSTNPPVAGVLGMENLILDALGG